MAEKFLKYNLKYSNIMKIIIEIKNKVTKLILEEKEAVLDEFTFPEDHNISERLLPLVDELLKRHSLTPKDIENFSVETDLGDSYTSRRIAETVANVFNWEKK